MTKKSKIIRILIVDDHSITRSGLKTILSIHDDLSLAGEASNGLEAVNMCNKVKPDVILMDISMPIMGGIEAIVKIIKKCPDVKIIALTSYVDKKLIRDALKAGAISSIIKNISRTGVFVAGEDVISPIPPFHRFVYVFHGMIYTNQGEGDCVMCFLSQVPIDKLLQNF